MSVEDFISRTSSNASAADYIAAFVTLAPSVLGVERGINWTHHTVALEEEEVVSANSAAIA